jgi:competence protein ComEA
MNFNNKVKIFFTFSRSEKRGILVLLIIILLLIGIRIYLNFIRIPGEVDKNKIEEALRSINDSNQTVAGNSEKEKINIKKAKLNKDSTHNFISKSEWNKNKNSCLNKLEINSADSTDLLKINGIGPVFSRRIIKYRNMLGGFYKVEQLKEVYGINNERYNSLHNYFLVDTTKIIRINLNNCSLFDLEKHPYISTFEAKAIIHYRKFKKSIQNINELKVNQLLSDSSYNKVSHYLTVL